MIIAAMSWKQYEILLEARPRGYHLITGDIVRELTDLPKFRVGLAHIFILHTSASLTINENASPDVLSDFESYFNRAVPDGSPYFDHTIEGPDDMAAHIKSSMLGSGLTIPIRDGRLWLGTWQGIYLCEHRNRGGRRRVVVTLTGEMDERHS
jgi:secondary thiamine-phosphate synthase enzyme